MVGKIFIIDSINCIIYCYCPQLHAYLLNNYYLIYFTLEHFEWISYFENKFIFFLDTIKPKPFFDYKYNFFRLSPQALINESPELRYTMLIFMYELFYKYEVAGILISPRELSHVNLILYPLFLIPASYFIFLIFINSKFENFIKISVLECTFLTFYYSLILFLAFDNSNSNFQFISDLKFNSFPWFNANKKLFPIDGYFLTSSYKIGIDGISLVFILLTTFLSPFCILIGWNSINNKIKEYFLILLFIEFLLLNLFCSLDFLFFFIFFESLLIPMFILIIVWGSRERKIHAAFQFFIYTLLGSVLMLFGIVLIYNSLGTTDIIIFLNSEFSEKTELVLWLCFFIPFAVKVPMFPFHIWLPEAHVEAPTSGSVLLAGVLLKLGTYGMLRLLISNFEYANSYFSPLVYTLSLLGVLYSSCTTIRQIDLKKVIAYSSVAHMNLIMLSLFSFNTIGLAGSIYLMLSHGLVSSALFICIGILYDRYHTRIIKYYNGLSLFMPLFSFFFLFFSFANIGLPLTSSFVGELLIMVGLFKQNILICCFSGIGMITGACYAMWLYNRVVYGEIQSNYFFKFSDLNSREFLLLFVLFFFVLLFGIFPNLILDKFHINIL